MRNSASVNPGQDRHGHWIEGLVAARRTGQGYAADPAQLRCSLPDAYALQRRHLRRLLADSGERVAGVKLGAATEALQEQHGLTAPLIGPILARDTHASGAALARHDFLACIVEPELGLLLCRDLDGTRGVPPRDDLLDAIAAVFPVLEVADSRYVHWDAAPACAIVADLAYAGAWVRGASCVAWQRLDLARLPVQFLQDGRCVAEGSTASVLGDPLHALALAVADAAMRGHVLRAGEVVSTGACTPARPVPVGTGARFVADFGPLGHAELTMTA